MGIPLSKTHRPSTIRTHKGWTTSAKKKNETILTFINLSNITSNESNVFQKTNTSTGL